MPIKAVILKWKTPSVLVGIVLVLLSGGIAWWVLAPVMRESDQASLLMGGLELSRNFEPWGADFYNYDKQWLSYWLLAGVMSLGGADALSLEDLVQMGNSTALVIGVLGVGLAVMMAGRGGWGPLLVGAGFLLTPAWMFSVPLLSSNVISAGFLGFWVVAMEMDRHDDRWKWITCSLAGCCAFMAVGSRADAALVLPAMSLAWWGVGRSWGGLIKSEILWASLVGAVAAFALGSWMSAYEPKIYPTFFKWETFTAYLLFGVGGVSFWYVGVLVYIGRRKEGVDLARRARELVWFLSLLLPILYYGRVLYSPRHLLTMALVVCLCGCFSASQSWWKGLFQSRAKWLFIFGYAALLIPMICGVQLESLSRGSLVMADRVTRYPTADGHWPMGRYVDFFSKLKNASEEPIDHNQRIWGAWLSVDESQLPEGEITVLSGALASYGKLWGIWNRRDHRAIGDEMPTEGVILGDDRALIKGVNRLAVSGRSLATRQQGWGFINEFRGAEIIGEYRHGRILKFSQEGTPEGRKFLEITQEFRKWTKGNSFVVSEVSEFLSDTEIMPQRRWVSIWSDEGGDKKSQIWAGDPDFSHLTRPDVRKGWIGWSELPHYFDVNRY